MDTDHALRAALRARLDRTPTSGDEGDVVVLAVLRSFDAEVFVSSALGFARSLEPATAAEWRRAFTRTVFLAGNPANLAARVAFVHTSDDGSVGWVGPATPDSVIGCRRMLKRFEATRPVGQLPDHTITPSDAVTAAGRTFRLDVATEGLTVSEYLVHVNHSIAEAVIDSRFTAGDRLTVHHTGRLNADEVPQAIAVRVHRDDVEPTRLRAYTALHVDAPRSA